MTEAAGPIGRSALVGFDGTDLPEDARRLLDEHHVSGVSLGLGNAGTPERIRALTDDIQATGGSEDLPRLVAADQEGAPLTALCQGSTAFPGNMALGAAGDPDLAYRVAAAIGRELRAVGVNMISAPVCDLATTPDNAAPGIRAFGDDPSEVSRLVAATVRGFQGEGLAATAKHFPGAGDADADPLGGPPVVPHGLGRLSEVELEPFRAAAQAGVSAMVAARIAVPIVTGRTDLPSSLSRIVLGDLLREGLRYDGVVLTDVMEGGALDDGSDHLVEAIAALRAGADLLRLRGEVGTERRLLEALARAVANEVFDRAELTASHDRVAGLRRRLALRAAAELDVVGCPEHRSLAGEVAERSVTMVRDGSGVIPLRGDVGRIAVVAVRPTDRPVDEAPGADLATSFRARHPDVDAYVTERPPAAAEIADLRERVRDHDLVVVGTFEASRDPRQAALVAALHEAGPPVIWVALSGPWDLSVYPHAPIYACTYGIDGASLDALAAAICGAARFRGRLPVALGGLHPRGHGLGEHDPGVA